MQKKSNFVTVTYRIGSESWLIKFQNMTCPLRDIVVSESQRENQWYIGERSFSCGDLYKCTAYF